MAIILSALALSLIILALLPKSSVSKEASLAKDFDIKIEYLNPSPDNRPDKIRNYFGDLKAGEYAKTFIWIADKYNLPYQLLPAIAMIESTGFKYMISNNGFGWGCVTDESCIHFDSINQAIEEVGKGLTEGYYASKSAELKLAIYNFNEGYHQRVMAIMEEIDNL